MISVLYSYDLTRSLFRDNTQPQGAKQGNHDFVMFSFDKPTTCDVCGKLLRGVFFQGYKCQSKFGYLIIQI